MKITKILSASVLAGAVLFSGTACSALDDGRNYPVVSATAEDISAEEIEAMAPAEEESVAAAVNGFYSYILTPGNLDEIKQAGDHFAGRSEVSDEELDTLVSDFPEGFQYFDTSDAQLIKNAYLQLLIGASMGETLEGIGMTVPIDAVTVDGETAQVDTTMIEITKNGDAVEGDAEPTSTGLLKLVKNYEGIWVIVAEAPPAK